MDSLLKPIAIVKDFPEVIEKTKKNHPFVYFISLLSLCVSLALLASYKFYIKPQADAHKAKLDEVALDLDNQKLFRSYEAKIIYLQQQILSNNQIKNNIGEKNIGEFSVNVISLCDTYKDDGLTVPILLGLIEVESGFKSSIISEGNAHGFLQVLRSTAMPYLREMGRDFSPAVLCDPTINLKVGTRFLIDLQRMYISRGIPKAEAWKYSLLCYNGGELNVNKNLNVGNNYATRVLASAKKWQRLGL